MKKVLTVSLFSFLFIFSLSLAVNLNADPPENSTCQAQCVSLGDLGMNHGECTSFCTSCTNNGNTEANCTCNFLEFVGALEAIFGNFGQCIKALK